MGIKLDYARAKAEADLHRYLESGHQNAPDALRAAVCYLKTLTAGLIAEYLKPDSQFPDTAPAHFRSAIERAEEYLWKCHFSDVGISCDCDFSKTDFSLGLYSELSQLWNHAVTDFWSGRAEYFARLGGGPLPAAVFAGPDNKQSDEPALAEPPAVDGAAASESSKFEQAGRAVSATVANAGNPTDRHELPEWDDVVAEYRATDDSVSPLLDGVSTPPLPAREQTDTARADMGAARPDLPRRSAQKIRATINGADTLLTQGILRLPTELQDGKRTKQEVEEILCEKSKEWAWDVFVTILREWAEIGIPPDDFEAIAKGQIESLSTHAEERVAAFVSTFQLPSGEVLRCVREFLPCLIPPYREENRFRFHSVRTMGKAVFPPQGATPQAGVPATPAEAQEQSREAERTVDSTDRSAAKIEATFPVRASWLKDRLLERGWSNSDPSEYQGPDRKTVQKILRGEAVRNDVLQKLADALSQKHSKVNVLDIPQD